MQDKLILTVLRYICQLREAHTRQLISYNIVIIGFFNWIKSNYIYVNLGQLIQDRFRINCNYLFFFFWGSNPTIRHILLLKWMKSPSRIIRNMSILNTFRIQYNLVELKNPFM